MSDDFNRRQLSPKHMEILAQFMERLRPLALASDRSRKGHAKARWMWEKIARHLNSVDGNVKKTGKLWARYWIDLKFKLRRKYSIIRRCQREGKECQMKFTPFEERLMKILTDDDGNLLSCTAVHEKVGGEWKLIDRGQYHNDTTINEDYLDDPYPMPTEHVNIPEEEIKTELPKNREEDPINPKKNIEAMKKEYFEFELMKQKELFEIEKEHRYEKHKLEIDILNLKKQILKKELSKLQSKKWK